MAAKKHVPHRLFPLGPPYDPPGNFLYIGHKDEHGEHTILEVLEEGGLPWVGLAFPGFDTSGIEANAKRKH